MNQLSRGLLGLIPRAWIGVSLSLLALSLRILRLEWQPLWWDEGYSVYFASETIADLVRLTAADIHPPLYYILLHFWISLWGNISPLNLRLLSVLIGVAAIPTFLWMSRGFPLHRGLRIGAALLLTFSPIHLFYSQEIRMYGLALLLGLVSTGLFWRGFGSQSEQRVGFYRVGYVLSSLALLYTLYYGGFLLLAHILWALPALYSKNRKRILAGTYLAIGLLYLPWILYALPELVPYVSQKVVADDDQALGLFAYLFQHLLAFIGGHVVSQSSWFETARLFGAASVAVLLGGLLIDRKRAHDRRGEPLSFIWLLTFCVGIPWAVGFILNQRLPFFPQGGERILLFTLPYLLLLILIGGSKLPRLIAVSSLAILAAVSVWGIFTFFCVPRYSDEDYRPIIRQVVQQGRNEDTVFLVFPWQVGYWHTYAPTWGRGELLGPWPRLTPGSRWSSEVAAALDSALEDGKVWFPAHLSLGGILEGEVESYLRDQSLNFENRWYTISTRLSGWTRGGQPLGAIETIQFGQIELYPTDSSGRPPVAGANQVVPMRLRWRSPLGEIQPIRFSLRLTDAGGRLWAIRDFEPSSLWIEADEDGFYDVELGLLVPAGVPPGEYRLGVGVGPRDGDSLLPGTQNGVSVPLADYGLLDIVLPDEPLSALRLPIRYPLTPAPEREGILLLGSSGFDTERASLAGTEVEINLFFRRIRPNDPIRNLYLSLVDQDGAGMAGWSGWPLPDYPTSIWPADALVRVPVSFFLPANLESDRYRIMAGFELEDGVRSNPVELGEIPVRRRAVSFDRPLVQNELAQPVQYGTHVRLFAYDVEHADDTLRIVLYWEVLQPLLPPHHVFVHLGSADEPLMTQDDDLLGADLQPAPSGSWLPGEIITDPHTLKMPAELNRELYLRVGLYRPEDGVRLEATIDGRPLENNAALIQITQ